MNEDSAVIFLHSPHTPHCGDITTLTHSVAHILAAGSRFSSRNLTRVDIRKEATGRDSRDRERERGGPEPARPTPIPPLI